MVRLDIDRLISFQVYYIHWNLLGRLWAYTPTESLMVCKHTTINSYFKTWVKIPPFLPPSKNQPSFIIYLKTIKCTYTIVFLYPTRDIYSPGGKVSNLFLVVCLAPPGFGYIGDLPGYKINDNTK